MGELMSDIGGSFQPCHVPNGPCDFQPCEQDGGISVWGSILVSVM